MTHTSAPCCSDQAYPDALSTPIREQDRGASTHSSRATVALLLHPLLLMAGVRNQKLLLAFLLSCCHDFGHMSCWQQQNNPRASRGGETPLTDGASQNPEQTAAHISQTGSTETRSFPDSNPKLQPWPPGSPSSGDQGVSGSDPALPIWCGE